MINGEVLSEFWERCPKEIREQIENTAKKRLITAPDGDVIMEDAADTVPPMDELEINETGRVTARRQSTPVLTLTETELESPHKPSRIEERSLLKPSDPDPYLSVGLDNVRSRSRRGSLAPLAPDEPSAEHQAQPTSVKPRSGTSSPGRLPQMLSHYPLRHSKSKPRSAEDDGRGLLPDSILLVIFQHLDLHHLLLLRSVSHYWSDLLTKSPAILHYLDLSFYNRKITDEILTAIICPFVRDRPRVIDINNCFHITDEGFTALANTCGVNVKVWRMKSVWDVTAPAILEMANKAKGLEEVDLSNCRKVSDTLLARIVGWIVPASAFAQQHVNGKGPQNSRWTAKGFVQNTMQTPAGTVFGCPHLKRLTLSYCKHVTDRSMHHIASHAASRLEEVDLTRCTTITDHGFEYWGNTQFFRLRKLCLADCTYLTDNAIVYLTNAAKGLQELDLVIPDTHI
jgi:F-box/leucine-rich repeat protein 7